MKKHHFILVLLFILPMLSFAQEKDTPQVKKPVENKDSVKEKDSSVNYMVEYDFKTKKYTKNHLKPKTGYPISYKINNINRLAHDIKITVTDSVISESYVDEDLGNFIKKYFDEAQKKSTKEQPEKPDKSAGLTPENIKETPQDDGNNSNSDSTNTSSASSANVIKVIQESADLSIQKGEQTVENDISEIKKISEDNINDGKPDENTSTENEKKITEKTEEIVEKVNKINESLGESPLKEHFNNYMTANNNFYESYAELEAMYKYCLKYKTITAELIEISSFPYLTLNEFEDNHKEYFKSKLIDIKHYEAYYETIEVKYKDFKTKYNTLISLQTHLNKILTEEGRYKVFEKLENFNKSADIIYQTITSAKEDKLTLNLERLYMLLVNENNYSYTSPPVQPLYDLVRFHVDIKKRTDNNFTVHDKMKYVHSEPTKNGLRLDFSIGVSGSLFDDKYNIELDFDRDGNQVVRKYNTDIFTPAFIGFFNASKRAAGYWSYGLSLGLGIGAENGTINFDNFFIGPSVIIGRYERIVVTGGLAFKNLPTLKQSFEFDDIVNNEYVLDNVANFDYRNGYFISVTYNLTNGIRKNIKKINDSF